MKTARTTEEMRFAASLQPCEGCGTRELGPLELQGELGTWTYRGACPLCGTERTFELTTKGNPLTTRAGRFDLGPGASELITPEQFLAVLDETSSKIPEDISTLSTSQRRQAVTNLSRALTSVSELLKLVPADGSRMPGTSDVRLHRSALEREYLRLVKLQRKHAPPSTIDQAMIDGHLAWLKRGASGPGQIVLQSKRLVDERIGAIDLTAAHIAKSDLTNVDMAYAILDEANLDEVVLAGARLDGISITHAQIDMGSWTSARLANANFKGVEVNATDFSKSDFECSTWYDAKVSGAKFIGARFGNSRFDRATFEGCDFHDASMARFTSEPVPTSAGARFIGCDLTNVEWSNRDLSHTTFVRCKLVGGHGTPSARTGLVIDNCDVEPATFLAQPN